MPKLTIKTTLFILAACLAVEGLGGLFFMASGLYNIAADEPHFTLARWMLQAGRTRSIQFRSRGIKVPNLRDPSLVRNGFVLYRKNCQPCHGAPGVAEQQIGRGINPKPPPLEIASNHWTNSQLFWITSHGLKMSGMPGFGSHLSETDRWAIVAFLRRIVLLSPADYERFSNATDLGIGGQNFSWVSNEDYGFAQLKAQGNSDRGRDLLHQYGCITCHTIAALSSGNTGPPLTDYAERQYIAGLLVNVPANTVAWITNPKRFKADTAMPNLNVQPAQALDMAAYLYTLGSPRRLTVLERIVAGHRSRSDY
ncbi:MAG: c-type cytochrome [Acidobacteriaceae bacterium]|nr:c-type cytochrome [Acidobacteriaceae bacterium]